MTYQTLAGRPLDDGLIGNYFRSLVNQFFKILPIREKQEQSLIVYMRGLQLELIGCHDLLPVLHGNPDFLKLLSILQYLIDHPDCAVPDVRAIRLVERLQRTFEGGGSLR